MSSFTIVQFGKSTIRQHFLIYEWFSKYTINRLSEYLWVWIIGSQLLSSVCPLLYLGFTWAWVCATEVQFLSESYKIVCFKKKSTCFPLTYKVSQILINRSKRQKSNYLATILNKYWHLQRWEWAEKMDIALWIVVLNFCTVHHIAQAFTSQCVCLIACGCSLGGRRSVSSLSKFNSNLNFARAARAVGRARRFRSKHSLYGRQQRDRKGKGRGGGGGSDAVEGKTKGWEESYCVCGWASNLRNSSGPSIDTLVPLHSCAPCSNDSIRLLIQTNSSE